mmetsp:Transcript_7521/g.11941  ORF Transcript_7521/g.11941 Transcript_7521/m.11941 type:complete len:468 (-) Transcript_7521:184-1587(-)
MKVEAQQRKCEYNMIPKLKMFYVVYNVVEIVRIMLLQVFEYVSLNLGLLVEDVLVADDLDGHAAARAVVAALEHAPERAPPDELQDLVPEGDVVPGDHAVVALLVVEAVVGQVPVALDLRRQRAAQEIHAPVAQDLALFGLGEPVAVEPQGRRGVHPRAAVLLIRGGARVRRLGAVAAPLPTLVLLLLLLLLVGGLGQQAQHAEDQRPDVQLVDVHDVLRHVEEVVGEVRQVVLAEHAQLGAVLHGRGDAQRHPQRVVRLQAQLLHLGPHVAQVVADDGVGDLVHPLGAVVHQDAAVQQRRQLVEVLAFIVAKMADRRAPSVILGIQPLGLPALAAVQVRAAAAEQVHHRPRGQPLRAPVHHAGQEERGAALGAAAVGVGTGAQQRLRARHVPGHRRLVQGGLPAVVLRVHGHAGLGHRPQRLRPVVHRRIVNCSPPFSVLLQAFLLAIGFLDYADGSISISTVKRR